MPANLTKPAPSIVHYVGYNGGRGHPLDNLAWAASGYVECQMDNRGQGSGWCRGATPDPAGSGPAIAGFMTKGISSPQTYYYRRLMSDAVRCVDAVASLEMVDSDRLAVYGGSQGGGLALAAAALSPLPKAVIAEVPFLADFRRGVALTDSDPFAEITRYLAIHHGEEDTVYHTLSYFDSANLAARATIPARFTVGLMDTIVPPSTVFAAYSAYAGPKEIRVWPHNGHEGGGTDDIVEALDFLSQHLAT
jgi:cephalosporin-C deacetylase